MAFEPKPIPGKDAIKFLILEKPSIKTDELQQELKDIGIEMSRFTVSSIRSELHHSLKIIKAAGLLRKRDPILPDFPELESEPKPETPKKKPKRRTWYPD